MHFVFTGIYYPTKNKFNVPVIVMEKMQNSLRSLVERHSELSISFNTITTILNDVCLGLQYLHSRTPPIIHRDLTPNNILLCHHCRAKISDLGVARTLETTDTTLTKIPGTFDFMAPECLGKNPVYGLPLDIFSFGGVILYITTQKWPHPASWIRFDPDSGEKVTLTSELQRRQQYLDKMTGICVNFKSLAISCLVDIPKNRPTVAEVLAKIKEVKNTFSDDCQTYYDVSIPSKQLEGTTYIQSQKQKEELPSNQQQRQQQQCQPQLHQEQEEQQQQQSTAQHDQQQEQEGQPSNHEQQQQQQIIVQQNQLQDQQHDQQQSTTQQDQQQEQEGQPSNQQKQQDQSEEQEQVWKNQQQLKQQEQNLERQQHQLQVSNCLASN